VCLFKEQNNWFSGFCGSASIKLIESLDLKWVIECLVKKYQFQEKLKKLFLEYDKIQEGENIKICVEIIQAKIIHLQIN
jgi:hypothetical protein